MADGESYKTLETAGRAYAACNQSGLERRSSIVALGGGVVGDVAGFVAGTYMRGLAWFRSQLHCWLWSIPV